MYDISISSTKVNGWPKGRPAGKPNKWSDQVVYPAKSYIGFNYFRKVPMWEASKMERNISKYSGTRRQEDLCA